MFKVIIGLLTLIHVIQCSISADLILMQYEPLVFKLNFSQPVSTPAFQLMLNNINEMEYYFLNSNITQSDIFYFQANDNFIRSSSGLESYQLIFNSPLTIGDGSLQIEDFIITAKKSGFEIDFVNALGIIAVIAGYLTSNFTLLGGIIIQYTQIYSLFMFKNSMKTSIYREIANVLLLINPNEEYFGIQKEGCIIMYLALPLALLLITGLIGFIMKRSCQLQRSIPLNVVYQIFTYNTFLNLCILFSFNLLYNSLTFLIHFASRQNYFITSYVQPVGIVLSYFNLISLSAIIYLFSITMNPHINQKQSTWQNYLKSSYFLVNMRKLTQGIYFDEWYRRNNILFIAVKRLLVVILYLTIMDFEYFILLFQFINLFYIFTLRPYKQQFFMNSAIIFRLMMFFYYAFVILANLYYGLGDITINYNAAKTLVTFRGSLFLIMIFAMVVIIFLQIYQKCSNLNYQISLVKEENQYKLKIIQRERVDTESTNQRKRKRKNSQKSDSTKSPRKSTLVDDGATVSKKSQKLSVHKNSQKLQKQNTTDNPLKSESPKRTKNRRNSANVVEIEMQDIDLSNNRNRVNTKLTNQSGKSMSRKKMKKKWNQKSLLAQIINDNDKKQQLRGQP